MNVLRTIPSVANHPGKGLPSQLPLSSLLISLCARDGSRGTAARLAGVIRFDLPLRRLADAWQTDCRI